MKGRVLRSCVVIYIQNRGIFL